MNKIRSKEETIAILKGLWTYLQEDIRQALEMAIKALEQEPCGDAISREEVLLMIDSFKDNYGSLIDLSREVRKMPPVNSQRQTGHWILADEQNKEDVENDNYRFICSECQYSDIHAKGTIVPYCWKCGCRMVKPQESEEV